jgi:SOS-response transcriptional repressor LexA
MDIQAAREADRAERLVADVSQLQSGLPGHDVRAAVEVGWRRLPMLVDIRAGDLAEALAASDEYNVLPEWVARGADFCLRVRGESMEPTLLDGDWVAVRQQAAAEPGQLVVARVEEGFTLKRYQEHNGARLLVADNPLWAPLACGPQARIVGVVTGMFRTDDVLRRRPEPC